MVLKNRNFQTNEQLVKKDNGEKKKKRRLLVLVLLLSTTLISSFLWSQSKITSFLKTLFKPATYHIVKPYSEELEQVLGVEVNIDSAKDLINSVLMLTDNLAGVYGLYFYNLETGETVVINENQSFTAASVNKVPIMVNFYQEVENERLDEDEIYSLKKADVQAYGTGQMRYQKLGTRYTYSDLFELSGKFSDNTAAYVLLQLIGVGKIQNRLNNLKMDNTSIKENTTTPKDMGSYFVKLYQDKLINSKNKEKVLTALTDTEFEERIPKYLPDNIRVAHKIGNEVNTYNDCGIIFGSPDYVLCLLTKDVKQDEALVVLPKISFLLWQYVIK
ncbi:serine hydrolase [Patescibacteria group bacterium]